MIQPLGGGSMTARVILNPYSNRWNSQKRWPEAESALKAAGVEYDLAISEKKGQVVELAEQAVRAKFSPIIVAGGDGTIGDAANGLMRALQPTNGQLPPLGIMPTGSANDLVYALGLPTDLNEAAKVIASGKSRAMDLGRLNDRYFINNSAAGLEPYVTIKHEKIHWIKGMARYLIAAVQAIMDQPEWQDLSQDSGEYREIFSDPGGNGRRTVGSSAAPQPIPLMGIDPGYGYVTPVWGCSGAARSMKTRELCEMEGMRESIPSDIIHMINLSRTPMKLLPTDRGF
jgi:hypothetical protein